MRAHTHKQLTETHTVDVKRGQGLTMGKSIQFIIGGRLQKEEENHNKSTQGCTRLNRTECLKGDSKSGTISGEEAR